MCFLLMQKFSISFVINVKFKLILRWKEIGKKIKQSYSFEIS